MGSMNRPKRDINDIDIIERNDGSLAIYLEPEEIKKLLPDFRKNRIFGDEAIETLRDICNSRIEDREAA